MTDSLGTFSDRLQQLDPANASVFLKQLTELFSQTSTNTMSQAYPAIFRFFESHPDTQMLGPFLHILDELFPDYLEELIQSVERMPTTNTLLMINRHLNGELDDSIRIRLMACLRKTIEHSKVSPIVQKEAAQYLRRQEHLDWHHLMLPLSDRSVSDNELMTDSVRAIEGSYVILRGIIVPTSVIQLQRFRFGLMAENQSAESWMSLPMHLMVAVELPKHLQVSFHTNPIVVEGDLSIDLERVSDGFIKTVYKVRADRILRPAS